MKAVCFACGQRKIKFATKRESREPLGRAVVRRSEVLCLFCTEALCFSYGLCIASVIGMCGCWVGEKAEILKKC